MQLYIVRRPNAWATLQEVEDAGARSAKIGNEQMSDRVRWIRSYVVSEPSGRFGSVCVYEAQDPGALQEHAKRAGIPGDDIIPVINTMIVREDPTRAEVAA